MNLVNLAVCVGVHGRCLHAHLGLRRLNNHVVHIVATGRCGPRLGTMVTGDVLFRPDNKGNNQRQDWSGYGGSYIHTQGLQNVEGYRGRLRVQYRVLTEVNEKRRKGSSVWRGGWCGELSSTPSIKYTV